MADLEAAIASLDDDGIERSFSGETTRLLHWLAASNYWSTFSTSIDISERVLFPNGPTESHGMEDARFVRFVDDDGAVRYFAPYTALDGQQILPQLIETDDFAAFRVTTLSGKAARNKGIAIFPRRIDGMLRGVGSARQRQQLHHDLAQRQGLERCHPPATTRATVGADAARQLWVTARDRSRVARDHPWGGAVPPVHPGRLAARSRRPDPRDRTSRRTVAQPCARRARGLRAQRRLLVRQHDPRRPPDRALRLRRRRARVSPPFRSRRCSRA